MADRAEASV